MARRSDGRSALQRQLRVLDAFDVFRPFLTLSEIASSAGLPHSTSHRIVGELTREGLLERMPDGTYRLGTRLWEYASRAPGVTGLREVARPWLVAAHARIRQHVQLGVLAGTDVLFVERLSTPGAVVNATLVGGRIPLHASSSGLVLLAHAEPHLVEQVLRRGLRSYTAATITTERELRAVLRRVRTSGYAVTPGHIHVEAQGVAVPVRAPDGSVVAAVGAVVPHDDGLPLGVLEALRLAAAGTSRALVQAYRPKTGSSSPAAVVAADLSERSRDYIVALRESLADGGGPS